MSTLQIHRAISGLFSRKTVEIRLLYFLVTVSLAVNIIFGLESVANRSRSTPPAMLPTGAIVPPIDATDLAGAPINVGFDTTRKGTLIYVFSPKCVWCERNKNNIRALVAQIRNDYDVIGISTTREDLAEYLSLNRFPFPTYVVSSPGALKKYRFAGTPTTYLISPTRVLQGAWQGAYSGSTADSIRRVFAVQLPDLLK